MSTPLQVVIDALAAAEVTELVMAARMVMADIEDYLDGAWDGNRDGWLACVDALGDALAPFTESQED